MIVPVGICPRRRGFTLVETMIAAAIGVIVLVAVMSSFIAAQSMLHTAMAESELSLGMRELRDKLLFKASPDISGVHYAGLLSGTSLNENEVLGHNSVEVGGSSVGSSLANMASSSVRLLVWPSGNNHSRGWKMLINDHTPNKDAHVHWLWPGSLYLVPWAAEDASDVGDGSDDVTIADLLYGHANNCYNIFSRNANGTNIHRIDLDVALAAKRKDGSFVVRRDGSLVVRRERISLPVLGKLQPMKMKRKDDSADMEEY